MAKKKTVSNGEQPATETKEQAFLRLANARVNKAIKALDMVGNLRSYKPAEAHTQKISVALKRATENAVARLQGAAVGGFNLEGQ